MSEPPLADDPERVRPWETTTDPGIGTSGWHALPPPSPWSSTSVIPAVPLTSVPPFPAPSADPWADPWTGPWTDHSYADQDQPVAPAHAGSLLDLEPGPESPSRGPARSRVVPAAVGLVILALLAGTTVLAASLLHGRQHSVTAATGTSSAGRSPGRTSTSPRPSATASSKPPGAKPTAAQSTAKVAATTINTDVARSVAARRVVGPATTHIGACRANAADVAGLDRTARIRTNLVSGLAHLDVHTLAGGPAVVAQLRTAWRYSARADAAYAAWGRAHRSCSGHAPTTGDGNYADAHHNDTLATAAKTRAVTLWNPIARRYHLPTRAAGAI